MGDLWGNETAWFDGVKTRKMTANRVILMTSTLDRMITFLLGQILH